MEPLQGWVLALSRLTAQVWGVRISNLAERFWTGLMTYSNWQTS